MNVSERIKTLRQPSIPLLDLREVPEIKAKHQVLLLSSAISDITRKGQELTGDNFELVGLISIKRHAEKKGGYNSQEITQEGKLHAQKIGEEIGALYPYASPHILYSSVERVKKTSDYVKKGLEAKLKRQRLRKSRLKAETAEGLGRQSFIHPDFLKKGALPPFLKSDPSKDKHYDSPQNKSEFERENFRRYINSFTDSPDEGGTLSPLETARYTSSVLLRALSQVGENSLIKSKNPSVYFILTHELNIGAALVEYLYSYQFDPATSKGRYISGREIMEKMGNIRPLEGFDMLVFRDAQQGMHVFAHLLGETYMVDIEKMNKDVKETFGLQGFVSTIDSPFSTTAARSHRHYHAILRAQQKQEISMKIPSRRRS